MTMRIVEVEPPTVQLVELAEVRRRVEALLNDLTELRHDDEDHGNFRRALTYATVEDRIRAAFADLLDGRG